MMGREAYDNPYILREVDSAIFNKNTKIKSRREILMNYLPYLESEYYQEVKLIVKKLKLSLLAGFSVIFEISMSP